MIKITECSHPQIQYPVARQCKVTKSIWLFIDPRNAICIDEGEKSSPWKVGEKTNFDINNNGWIPVDVNISAY